MDANKKRRLDSYCLRDPLEEPPTDKIQSQKNIILKELAARQQEVTGDLNQYLNNKKEFVSSQRHSFIHQNATGIMKLNEFLKVHENESSISHLLDCGLNEPEIEIKLQDEGKGLGASRSLLEPRIRDDILKSINDRISQKEKEVSQIPAIKAVKLLSRLQFELEETLKPNSELCKLSSLYYQSTADDDKLFRLSNEQLLIKLNSCESDCSTVSNVNSSSPQNPQLIAKNNLKPQCDATFSSYSRSDYSDGTSKFYGPKSSGSGWDSKVLTCLVRPAKISEKGKVKQASWFTIEKDRIVPAKKTVVDLLHNNGNQNFVARRGEDMISTEGRLSVNEIRAMEKFRNYDAGIPSKTLYLKNFGNSITENGLVGLFSQYECSHKPRLVYRILKGRMKGQAFVTFPDIDTAKQALEDNIGLLIKGRPLIIEYGKQ